MSGNLVYQAVQAQLDRIDRDELDRIVSQCSGFVKMMTGVANNCAIGIVREAYNHVAGIGSDYVNGEKKPRKAHPRFRHEVKREFKRFFNDWRDYELRLLYPAKDRTRFFCVGDLTGEARKMFGEMTDQQYFKFWQATGSQALVNSQPLVTSLQNKFRLALEHHGVEYPQQVAWAMVGESAMVLAMETWKRTMRSCRETLPVELSQQFVESLWMDFYIGKPAETWKRAVLMLEPRTDSGMLDEVEMRNIALGLAQLRELWASADHSYNSTIQAVEDFDKEIFRTRGQAKKAIRQLTEMREETKEELLKEKMSV